MLSLMQENLQPYAAYLSELFEPVVPHVVILEDVYALILVAVIPHFIDDCTLPLSILFLHFGQSNCTKAILTMHMVTDDGSLADIGQWPILRQLRVYRLSQGLAAQQDNVVDKRYDGERG